MTWEVKAVSTGQAYLVGDPEEEDFVLILTLSGVGEGKPNLWCAFDHSFACNHIEKVKDFWT